VKCGTCARSCAVVLPDGSLQVTSHHGGTSHITIIPVQMIVEALPVPSSLQNQIMIALKLGG